MEKENWIQDVLHTARHITPIPSHPYMALRIEEKLQQTTVEKNMPIRWVYTAAAAILLLIITNITVWRISAIKSMLNSSIEQLVREYGWGSNDLYSMNLSNPPHE
jgi:hypothetical protein